MISTCGIVPLQTHVTLSRSSPKIHTFERITSFGCIVSARLLHQHREVEGTSVASALQVDAYDSVLLVR